MATQTSDGSSVEGRPATPVYIMNQSLPGAGVAGPTQPVSLATLPTTENHLGEVGGHSAVIVPTITTSAPAYSANDVVGGVITLSNIVRVAGGTGILQSMMLTDDLNQKAALDIYLFNALPNGSGAAYADNGAFAWGTGDLAKLVRKISVLAGDWTTIGSKAVVDLAPISKVIMPTSGRDMYMIIVTTGTPTYAANSTTLGMRMGIIQD